MRLLSVADVYDALASPRPYRAALRKDECLAELRRAAATGGLDPALVETFAARNVDLLPTPVSAPGSGAAFAGPTPAAV